VTATSDQGRVLVDRTGKAGQVATLTLDRPGALNSLTPEMVRQLRRATAEADRDPTVAVIVLGGGDSASFCAGADLRSTDDDTLLEPLPDSAYLCAKPVVAALRGWTVGVGLKLACAADLVLATEDTVMWAPETRVGILGTGDLGHRLVRQLPYRVAMELSLAGTQLPAHRAHELGLINEVVPHDLLEHRALAVAELIAGFHSVVDFAAWRD
jgi:crotonobetainyl-CoA hydratase